MKNVFELKISEGTVFNILDISYKALENGGNYNMFHANCGKEAMEYARILAQYKGIATHDCCAS